jgi:hypothetical protein
LLVAVDPDSVKFEVPSDTVKRTCVEGVITPAIPVEVNVEFELEIVKTSNPDVAEIPVETIDTGGIKPWLPSETSVSVDPEVENCALPALMMVVVLMYAVTLGFDKVDALGDGGMSPPFPVDVKAEVAPEIVIMTELCIVEACPLTTGRSDPGTEPGVGGMMPLAPVEVCVAKEMNVICSPLPLVVVAATKLGPTLPPPPITVLVEDPVMYVVVEPLKMVVTTVVLVNGAAVPGCCTTV